jgi:hypothetical protein
MAGNRHAEKQGRTFTTVSVGDARCQLAFELEDANARELSLL